MQNRKRVQRAEDLLSCKGEVIRISVAFPALEQGVPFVRSVVNHWFNTRKEEETGKSFVVLYAQHGIIVAGPSVHRFRKNGIGLHARHVVNF